MFAPGDTIMVTWRQEVAHGGSYRLAFGPNDDAGFDDNVLLEIAETDMFEYAQEVTLPACECDGCTLQLWQIVSDSGYYSCADIELRAPTPGSVGPCAFVEPPAGDPGTSDDDGGDSADDGTTFPSDDSSGDGAGDDAADDAADDGTPGEPPGDADASDATAPYEDVDTARGGSSGGCRIDPTTPRMPLAFGLALALVGVRRRRR